MLSGKRARRALALTSLVAAAVTLVYLLRWPLFGGIVRARLEDLAARELGADLARACLEGSLLTGVSARDVVLRPRPGAPFREARADRLSARYGLLGAGLLRVEVRGARVVLAEPAGPPAPVHEVVRDAFGAWLGFRFPGRLHLESSEIVLPGGETVRIERASFDAHGGAIRFEAPAWGRSSAAFRFGPAGTAALELETERGPVETLRFELGPTDGARPFSARLARRDLALEARGRVTLDARGRLARAEADLSARQGHARVEADFVGGHVWAGGRLEFALEGDLSARISIEGRIEGPMAGPPEAWTLRALSAQARDAAAYGLAIDGLEAESPGGTLGELPWSARVRRGPDEAEARGILRWTPGGAPRISGTASLRAEDLEPYARFLNSPAAIRARDVRVSAAGSWEAGALRIEGELETGLGAVGEEGWEALRLAGSFRSGAAEIRELALRGTAWAPLVRAQGRLEAPGAEGRRNFSASLEADGDALRAEGFWTPRGGAEVEFVAEGPFRWLGALGVEVPPAWTPLRASGEIRGSFDELSASLELGVPGRLFFAPDLSVRREGHSWIVEARPGAAWLAGRWVELSAFRAEIGPGVAALSALRFRTREPDLSARLDAYAAWDGREVRAGLEANEISVAGVSLDGFEARAALDRRAGTGRAHLAWGSEAGDHLLLSGVVGRELDIHLGARLDDLGHAAVRELFPGLELSGAAGLEVRIAGPREQPSASGRLSLSEVSALGTPPLSLEVPLRTEEGRLRARGRAPGSPFGDLVVEADVPLADLGARTPLDVAVRLETSDLGPILERVPEEIRPHLPRDGRLRAALLVGGTVGAPAPSAKAELEAPGFPTPGPLGPGTDLRADARWEPGTLILEGLQARLGYGRLRAEGRWDSSQRGRPLALQVTGKDLLVVDGARVRVRVDPDIRLTWREGEGWRAAGKVEVPLLLYYEELGGGPRAAAPSPGAAREVRPPSVRLPAAPEGGTALPGAPELRGLALDLEVTTPGEIRVENATVAALLSAHLRVRGTGAEPAVTGTVRARSGEVKLATGVFLRLRSAEVVFPAEPGALPRVRFEAEAGSGTASVLVIVDGPLEDPELFLRSEPPRSQEDLLAFLAFGHFPGEVSGGGALGTLALRFYQEQVGARPSAEPRTGLLERLHPSIVFEGGSAERRAPWELPAAGTGRGTVFRTEYFLSPHVSVVVETDREAHVSGDVKLRLRFR